MCNSCKPPEIKKPKVQRKSEKNKSTTKSTEANTHSEISENVILIRINKTYSPLMSTQDLYDVTRGVWKVGDRREKADYAFAVYGGVIVETYVIANWENATVYSPIIEPWRNDLDGRYQFVGKVDEAMRKKYKNLNISHYFVPGNANPIMYINC